MIPVRVLVVTPWFPSARKPGAGAFMLRDVDLLRVNHEVTVLHLAEAKDIDPEEPRRTLTPSGAVVLRQPFNPVNPVAIHQASRTIRNLLEEADVVHTMAMHALLPVRIAWPSVPWVHTEHWSGLMQERLPLRKWVGLTAYRSSLACPDAVAAVGRSLARAVERTRSGSAAIIPNHVVLGSPDRLPDPPTTAGPGPLRIVAVGNLIEHKGPLITLETLAELRERGVEADLTWIGAGPLEAEVQRRVDEMRLADSVNMVGQIAPAEIPDRLLAAQVFVLPTASETFGVAFAEALGQGLPAVATGHGGHLDFLPLEASRIATDRSGRAVADALLSLVADPKRWHADQIMAYAHEHFSERARQSAYAELYNAAKTNFVAKKPHGWGRSRLAP